MDFFSTRKEAREEFYFMHKRPDPSHRNGALLEFGVLMGWLGVIYNRKAGWATRDQQIQHWKLQRLQKNSAKKAEGRNNIIGHLESDLH